MRRSRSERKSGGNKRKEDERMMRSRDNRRRDLQNLSRSCTVPRSRRPSRVSFAVSSDLPPRHLPASSDSASHIRIPPPLFCQGAAPTVEREAWLGNWV
ncbi:unnamed protein product [Cuscuta epithymum]|uniref:Uncharacterized protein n=1 Tax=Cuscuta epithymum TaxID=186058 RepID=A0AAV0FHU7_9ASTE|nr:unnamed protein product [Cuscuta epithymum]